MITGKKIIFFNPRIDDLTICTNLVRRCSSA